MSDDQQAMALGCMGNDQVETPNLDRLAARGVVFDRCYATTSICMASRTTVMTGMYEYKTGCNFLTGNLPVAAWKQSYPVLLHEAGYRTGFAGKWGFTIEDHYDAGLDFDRYAPLKGGQGFYHTKQNPTMVDYAAEYPHVTRALGAFGRDFIEESVRAGQPFCLSISFKAPHKPHDIIDPQDKKRYSGVEFRKSVAYGADNVAPQARLGRQYLQRGEWNERSLQDHTRAYYQLISGVDTAVGMIVEALEQAGVADNTVIIYTSDNGYFCGVHDFSGKVLPYEHGARIPLIVVDPRLPASVRGRRSSAVVGNIDFAPTMLEWAGLPVPAQMDGRSLVPLLTGERQRTRDYLTLIQAWDVCDRDMPKALGVVSEQWKYIYWYYGNENLDPTEELYNLWKDPNELHNLAGETAAVDALEEMRSRYDESLAHWKDNAVDGPYYRRYAELFDRSIPWTQKHFRTGPEFGDRWPKWRRQLEAIYRDVVGADYPAPALADRAGE